MDVVVWLRSLGLGKYEAAFRENEIDETVLPNLTARGPEGAWRRVAGTPREAARCYRCSANRCERANTASRGSTRATIGCDAN